MPSYLEESILGPLGTAIGERIANHADGSRIQKISTSFRMYCYTDNRWIGFNPIYGSNFYQFNGDFGTGSTPNTSWTDTSLGIIPDGAKLNRLIWVGRGNNIQTTGVQIYVDHMTLGDMVNGWDANVEVTRTLISNHTQNFAYDGNDRGGFELDLSALPNIVGDGILGFYIRPIGTITATRYIYVSLYIEYTI